MIDKQTLLNRRTTKTHGSVPNPPRSADWLHIWAYAWERPLGSALLAFEFYGLLTVWYGLKTYGSAVYQSAYPYFNYLADAFLHGELHLRLIPAETRDLIFWHDQYFLYWPPLPAFLLVPFVAVFGVQFSDVAFTLCVATLNVLFVAVLLREACCHSVIRLNRLQRGLFVSCFALGTVHLTLAPYGRVWFTSQLVCLLCIILAYLACMTLRGGTAWLAVGIALAGAMLTRNHTVLAGLWPVVYLLNTQGRPDWRQLRRKFLLLAIPLITGLLFIGTYDWLRFGSAFDNGYAHHNMNERYLSAVAQYGLFSVHYLPINVYYQYVAYPFPLDDAITPEGAGLFWLTPVFIGAFWGLWRRRNSWSGWTLLATIILINIPILLLLGTGWVQFGPRYSLDFTIPLLLLTALGIQRWPTRALALFTLASIVQYLIGTIYLGRILN
jgi:hypothetical protein